MYGQKEILSCCMIVGLVAILNFYKSIIKRDKEIQNSRRSLIDKEKLEHRLLLAERAALNHAIFRMKMLEYNDRCYDLHALIYRPHDYDGHDQLQNDFLLKGNANASFSNEEKVVDGKGNGGSIQLDSQRNSNKSGFKAKESKINEKPSEKADSSCIAYVLVAILLGSLIKAALDLTKHYKKKANNETETDILRRCSLQEYSLLKHKQKKASKAPFFKKSISSQRSLDSSSKITLQQHDQLLRRMSGNPQEYSNGPGLTTSATTEPSTPAKPGKLLAGRPVPLLRRCSVPIYTQNQPSFIGQPRRPSVDSFCEDDSGAETKRRVRMIHRH